MTVAESEYPEKSAKAISVIIPCKNEETGIQKLLSDLRRQKLSTVKMEVIVSDAKSDDRTAYLAKKSGARIVLGGIPAVGRNRGAQHSKGDIIIFFDADVVIEDEYFIEDSVNEFLAKNLDCAAMRQQPHFDDVDVSLPKQKLIRFLFKITNFLFILVKNQNPRAIGNAMVFRRDVFLKTRGFREDLYWGEDSELVQRLAKSGYKFGILQTKINCSVRKLEKQGIFSAIWNSFLLDYSRQKHGQMTKSDYRRITGIKDYYEK